MGKLLSSEVVMGLNFRCPDYQSFWPYYLFQHLNKANRRLHFIGTSLVLLVIAHWFWLIGWEFLSCTIFEPGSVGCIFVVLKFVVVTPLHFVAVLLCGYGFAWIGHYFFGKNQLVTFKYPLWSLRANFHMWWLVLTRQMDRELIWLEKHVLGNVHYLAEHPEAIKKFFDEHWEED